MLTLKHSSIIVKSLASIFLLTISLSSVQAENMVPRSIDYQGVILDANNNPITTPLNFRFSFWSGADYTASDLTEAGEINPENGEYAGYEETQAITPDKNGNFHTAVGLISPLPDLNAAIHKYLQVEVKSLDEPNTAYELLDIDDDINNDTDRKLLSSAPYAITSDAVDNSDIGYGAGQIPQLNAEGKLEDTAFADTINGVNLTDLASVTHVQNTDTGTNAETFVLNADDSEGDIRIQFGTLLNKGLKWASEALRFEIGDALHVWGAITSDGTVNGRDLSADGAKLDAIEAGATADQNAEDVPFTHETFLATNVFDALLGLKTLIGGNTELITGNKTELDGKIANLESQMTQQASGSVTQNDLTTTAQRLQTEIQSVRTSAQNDVNTARQSLQANIDAVQTNLNGVQTNLEGSISSTESALNQRIADLESQLQSQIEQTQSDQIDRALYDWEFIPGTDNRRGLRLGQGFQNKGFVMTRAGKITAIAVAANPLDRNAEGSFFITKNDDGEYDAQKRMTFVTLNSTGTGDANNSAYSNDPEADVLGLSFAAGDVIRVYHEGSDEFTTRVSLEVEYQ